MVETAAVTAAAAAAAAMEAVVTLLVPDMSAQGPRMELQGLRRRDPTQERAHLCLACV